MANHEVQDAFPVGGSSSADNIQQMLAKGFKWVLDNGDDMEDIDLTGLTPRAVEVDGITFVYDPEDSTSGHDGTTTLVSSDGKRFIATELSPRQFVNVAAIRNAPLGSEVAGDRLIVGTAPTGDFAGHADDLTVKNGAGDWVFVEPEIGQETYVVDVESKYHYTAAGAWAAGTGQFSIDDGAISARALDFPFGYVAEDELTKPPADLIAQNDGTANGDMTGGGGLAAAHDTTESQAASACASKAATTSAMWGKQFSAPKKIEYVGAIPSNDEGFASGGSVDVTLSVYGWDSATPPADDDDGADLIANGTLLGTLGPFDDETDEFATRFIGSDDRDTEWDGCYILLTLGSSATAYLAEGKFYEPADIASGTKYIIAANAIGVFEGEDGNIGEARGSGTWFIHEAYEGAQIIDRGDGLALKKFVDGEWETEGGSVEIFDASGTWNKPSFGTFVTFLIWGGGGSGASSAANQATGGGGGAFNMVTLPLSVLPSSLAITVGLGGASVSGTVAGNAGGVTRISVSGRVLLEAYGGGAGIPRTAAASYSGGAGGGTATVGGNGVSTNPSTGGTMRTSAGADGSVTAKPTAVIFSGLGCGGGAGGGISSPTTPFAGGDSSLGGAGGGAVAATVPATPTAGGISIGGGNGGAATIGAGVDGSAPGGGGGAAAAGAASGKGADGRVIVIIS